MVLARARVHIRVCRPTWALHTTGPCSPGATFPSHASRTLLYGKCWCRLQAPMAGEDLSAHPRSDRDMARSVARCHACIRASLARRCLRTMAPSRKYTSLPSRAVLKIRLATPASCCTTFSKKGWAAPHYPAKAQRACTPNSRPCTRAVCATMAAATCMATWRVLSPVGLGKESAHPFTPLPLLNFPVCRNRNYHERVLPRGMAAATSLSLPFAKTKAQKQPS